MLEIARVHHDVLLDVLRDSRREDLRDIATAASEFLVEVLATYDMTHRSLPPRTAERADSRSSCRPPCWACDGTDVPPCDTSSHRPIGVLIGMCTRLPTTERGPSAHE